VDTSEGAGDDGGSTEETGLESGVLAGRSLTVVLVTDNDPSDTLVAVLSSDLGNTTPVTSELVLDLVRLAVRLVDGTDQACRTLEVSNSIAESVKRAAYSSGRCSRGDRGT
jgi:hypothetical protein